jgi:hypothetical protein
MCSRPKRVHPLIEWEKKFAEKKKEWETSTVNPDKVLQ